MGDKLRAFLCTGCGIGDALDAEKLAKVATSEYKIPECVTHACLCGEEGRSLVAKALADDGVNTVVLAACSPRVCTDAWPYDATARVLERVNLREHVVWCQPAKHEDTQAMAEDYLRMAIVKAQKSSPLAPHVDEASGTILVVGGGTAGLAAALDAAGAGADVVLVEKTDHLGGFAAKVRRTYPTEAPFRDLQESGVAAQVAAVTAHPRIKVYTAAQVQEVTGQPGQFDVTIARGGATEQVRVGAVVVATGWQPYDATKLGHLGYGRCKNVITSVQLEEMARAGKLLRPGDGKPATKVAFIQCAGSRDQDHLHYCSAVCCRVSLKQALYVRELDPSATATIIYKDLRAPGEFELFYKRVQEDEGIFLTKGDVVEVTENPDQTVTVVADNTLLGEKVAVTADLVVLATGMVPATVDNPTLNLTYRQGKELPTAPYGFTDSEFICFPYETQRTGMYAAGAVHQPMDTMASLDDAAGAAMKAIQCVDSVRRGVAVHPRAGDLSFPEFFLQRCTQCKRCTEECPFGTLDEDEKGTPKPNPNRCRRCGVCMGACPERIISFKNYSVDMVATMIKAIEVPEEDEEKPRVLVLMCENDAYPALDMVGLNRLSYDPMFRVIPVRCLGSVNLVWIADSLSKGIDGVMLIGCKFGDDYQCHFIKGSEIANRRLENLKETLTRLALESDRVKVVQLAITDYDKLPAIFGEFADTIREVGPNPYKGF